MAYYQFYREQKLHAFPEEVWNFISSPKNLKVITPSYMGFDIISNHLPDRMYPGLIVAYKVSPLLGIRTTWVTEITHVKEGEFFVDEQRIGPYSLWHHQHILEPLPKGVLMKDIVTYKPPLGILGALANQLIIRKKLNEIFDYRKGVLERIFNADRA